MGAVVDEWLQAVDVESPPTWSSLDELEQGRLMMPYALTVAAYHAPLTGALSRHGGVPSLASRAVPLWRDPKLLVVRWPGRRSACRGRQHGHRVVAAAG